MIEIKGSAHIEVVNSQLKLVELSSKEFINRLISHSADSSILTNEYILNQDSLIKQLNFTYVFVGVSTVYFFDSCSKWVQLEGLYSLTAYHFLSCEIGLHDGTYLYINNKKPFTVQLQKEDSEFRLTIIHDAPYLHPTWNYSKGQRVSTALKLQQKGVRFLGELKLSIARSRKTQVVPSYYPLSKACFILTDHCDFDSVEKLKLFLHGNVGDGWLKKGLKITKGVFRYGPKANEIRKSDDLEVLEYSKLVDLLYNDGSEICPHALKHSGQLDKESFIQGLFDLERGYKPRTWIDHGSYISYCYSQDGHLNSEYRLVKTLNDLNYNSIWSFHDISLDPSYNLNFFHSEKYSHLNGFKIMMRHLLRGRVFVSAHYFRSFFHKGFSDSLFISLVRYMMGSSKKMVIAINQNPKSLFAEFYAYIKRVFKFDFKRASENVHYSLKEINVLAPPIFTENHQTINNFNTGLFFFNTIETTHTKDVYSRIKLERLISERGLHLGHTYILNDLPYINGIFDRRNRQLALSEEWIEFTSILALKIKAREIWNPTMGEFSERIKSVLNIEIDHVDDFINVKNNNDVQVDDFIVIDQFQNEHSIQLRPFESLRLKL